MMKVALLLLSCADAVVSYVVANNGPRLATRPNSPRLTTMRAPYDSRSVTETFEMWDAPPPAGFTWGYDSRSTTENYEQWLARTGDVEGASNVEPPEVTNIGVPSVTPSVYSWYDAGVRLALPEMDPSTLPTVSSWYDAGIRLSAAGATTSITPTVLSLYDINLGQMDPTITLTIEQVKAYGGPAVRPLTYLPIVLTPAQMFYSKDIVTLTDQQVKAYGGPTVRPLTYPAIVTSWYDAGIRLIWPTVGGSAGYHRMAGRLTRPKLPTKPKEWPTVGGSAGYHRMAGRLP